MYFFDAFFISFHFHAYFYLNFYHDDVILLSFDSFWAAFCALMYWAFLNYDLIIFSAYFHDVSISTLRVVATLDVSKSVFFRINDLEKEANVSDTLSVIFLRANV